MRSTIRQVAEKAQVSRMTVSRVLQGRRHQVNEETYERVLAVMREMNYVPVRPAVQNRHIETNVIGLVPYHRNPARNRIDSLTFEGLCEGAAGHGYDLFIMLRGEAEWMANREELRFLDRRCDGFIFISPGVGEWKTALETLVEHQIPAVVCYRRDVPAGVAWVDPDNETIVDLALECLLKNGHRRLAYLGGPKPNPELAGLLPNMSGSHLSFDDQMRSQRFLERLSALEGYPAPLVMAMTSPDWQLCEEEVRQLMDSGVTGVLCLNDHLALQLWKHAEALGYHVPRDLSIIGVDNQHESAHRGLTSIGFGYDEIGHHAVQAWLALRAGKPLEECHQVVPVSLVERDSVAPLQYEAF